MNFKWIRNLDEHKDTYEAMSGILHLRRFVDPKHYKIALKVSVDDFLMAMEELYETFKIDGEQTQKEILRMVAQFVDSHFYKFYKKMGTKKADELQVQKWTHALEVVQALMSDTNDWMAKSAEMKRLVGYLKRALRIAEREQIRIQKHYARNEQAWSEFSATTLKLSKTILRNHDEKNESVDQAIKDLTTRVFSGLTIKKKAENTASTRALRSKANQRMKKM